MTKITRLNDGCDEHWAKVVRLANDLAEMAGQAGRGKLISLECGLIRERCENIINANARHRAGYSHAADTNILDELDAISRTLHARDFQPSARAWLTSMMACVEGMRRAVMERSRAERVESDAIPQALRRVGT